MSKHNRSSRSEQEKFQQEHAANSQKVRDAGIHVGKTSGLGNDNYYFHDGLAYNSHAEAVKDIAEKKGL